MIPSFLRTTSKFPLPPSSDKVVLLFDIETNGFYNDVNKIHCIVIKDVNSGQTFSYRPDRISNALVHLDSADVVIGHNIIFYDIPVIEKLHPGAIDFSTKEVIDTLVCVRLLWPKEKLYEIDQVDFNHVPSRLMGSASLEAWGHRFKDYKGDFKNFGTFTQEMLDYCLQDVSVSFKLYKLLCDQPRKYERALRLEHDLARCIERQIRSGFGFDVDAANDLVAELEKRKDELEGQLREAFPSKDEGDWFTPKVNNKNKGYVSGVMVWRPNVIEFNPGSRQQICEKLKEKYGWEPTARTEKGNPILDDEVLEKLIYPEAKLLSEYMLIKKRLGQIKEGSNAWLKLVTDDNFIHGDLITNGCITGRASHKSPNMAQVPAGYSPFGKECRSLFLPPDGFDLIGVDAKALELRCLAGYLAIYDQGEYGRLVCDDDIDIHSFNQEKFGVATRDISKRLLYAVLYGAGYYKAGTIVDPNETDSEKIKQLGREAINSFMAGVPALALLKKSLSSNLERRGFLLGLDKRPLFCRSEFKSLNVLLQAAGAVLMKQVVINIHRNLNSQGLIYGIDWQQHAFVHDEVQLSCRPGVADKVKELSLKSFIESGNDFKFRVPIEGDAKLGSCWYETH
jgi:DNA polymerase I-like protein with 3'-5' exonuclease and polymerase domains